ncbi:MULTISPECIES: helix-turn-helix transcriptional regulator [Actinoplanes]|uniref:helix-turn-helix transcriptional regulator n=1 Tax=Actinoplanes TaxID=1865 RepID=UPI0005F2EFB6|nr:MULTISPECIES: helix-turn-helix transcriptional regulator [Actinoplanes]GLY02114.1 DNA-binding protein [Actinoplanes sp. NBRC 101535]
MDRAWLGEFLRRRREALSPQEVGLPARRSGRTPGLRREEVAALATVSATYYERLEQGRGPYPSAAVLSALATALRLTGEEEAHLFRLAGQSVPVRVAPTEQVDPALAYVLEAVADTTPAFVTDDLGTVLAQNRLNIALFGGFVGVNLIWHWFTSPTWRHRLDPPESQEQTGLAYTSDLRTVIAERGHDGAAGALVDRLSTVSEEFRGMWGRHAVASLHCPTKIVDDERVGRIEMDCVIVASQVGRQRMLMLKPVPGTPSAARLAALHATAPHNQDVVVAGARL